METILEQERLLGTVLNLIASFAALITLPNVLGRPLDYWDVGAQVGISAAVELIVFQVLFDQGRLGWPFHKAP
jgi:hypothetical protein